MIDVAERLEKLLPQCEIGSFCRRWKIHELSFFGSVLRDDFGPASDIDGLI
jgi:predicted nucleotidyltransferase